MKNNVDNTLRHGQPDPTGQKLAQGLGWFSIGLGLLEIGATKWLVQSLGMRGNHALLRSYGVREILTGLGILGSKDPTPFVWGRVVGDALDLGTLLAHLHEKNDRRENVAVALLNVLGATAADIYCANKLSRTARGIAPDHDYRDRSGLPTTARVIPAPAAEGSPAAMPFSPSSGS